MIWYYESYPCGTAGSYECGMIYRRGDVYDPDEDLAAV